MREITKVKAVSLACGLQQILLDMTKKGKDALIPIAWFEDQICQRHGVDRASAELVVERILDTGILRWDMHENAFIL